VPFVPLASIACCFILMASLPVETWIRFFVWLGLGLAVYFLYSRHNSKFEREAEA